MKHAVVTALALLLAACSGEEGPGARDDRLPTGGETEIAEAERFGGTAVTAAGDEIISVNPLTTQDQLGNQITQFVLFTPLITYNERFEPVPRLARSWEVNSDTTELVFHLRDDVFWHDGRRTTAHDVKFSYDLARNPETGFPNPDFWKYYGEATVPDSFTFRVKLRPHTDFLDPWRAFAPVPRHVLQDVAPSKLSSHPFGTQSPVGNGPFRFVSHAQDQNWVFEANPRFPRELGGRPYVDRLVYRSIPEPTTILTELLTGGVDYYIAPTSEHAQQIRASDRARLVTFPDRSYTYIAWNQRRPPFRDTRVRRALAMAINRQAIIQGVLDGYGKPGNATVPPIFWQFDPQSATSLPYDPEAAKRLLAEAGYLDRNGDGIVEDPQGRPFRFTIKSNQGSPIRNDIAVAVQSDLRRIGVDAQPQILEWGTLVEQVTGPEREFDAVVFGYGTEFQMDDAGLFHCERRDEPFHLSGYCDPEADRLLDTLPKIVDRRAAKPLWARLQRKIAADQPITLLYFQERREGVHNRLRNVDPDARGDLVGVDRWYILPDQRRGRAPQQTPTR